MTTGLLDGLRVLECCGTDPGSFCGKLLADLGAEVLKVERPEGDRARVTPPFAPVRPSAGRRSLYLDTGKGSVVVGSDPEQAARWRDLLKEADVVIDDGALGVDRVDGCTAIWCRISPFGATGPYQGFLGCHLTTFHAGGEGHLLPSGAGFTMFPDRPPLQIGGGAGDFDVAANAAVAILAAWYGRAHVGRTPFIDVSAQESHLTLNRTRLSLFTNDGVTLRRRESPYPVGGMVRCSDGYVQVVGLRDEHWRRLAHTAGWESLAAELDRGDGAVDPAAQQQLLVAWCASRSKEAVAATLSEAGASAGAFAEGPELLHSEQLRHRGFFQTVEQPGVGAVTVPGVPYRFSRTPVVVRPAPTLGDTDSFRPRTAPEPATAPEPPTAAPLAGLRVVDFTWAAAGPYATLLLSMLGAEVIKVETSKRPDPARRGFMADYGGPERSPNFNELNVGKLSFQVDLTHPLGLAAVRRLVATADVVVDNFRPGVMDRLGLGHAPLLADHPHLVVASSSAHGSTGPEAFRAGLASIFGAASGLSAQTGYPDGPPTEIGESSDYRSGNALAIGILAALLERRASGLGQFVDLSSSEVLLAAAPDRVLAAATGAPVPGRLGNGHTALSPHGVFPAEGDDAWIAIAVADEDEWSRLCHAMVQPELAGRYPTLADRQAAEDEIAAIISEWTRSRTASESFLLLQQAGVRAAPSWTNEELAADPHLSAREAFVVVEHPVIGAVRVLRAPWRTSWDPAPRYAPGPLLGQHNDVVLQTLLGLSADEQAALTPALV